MESASHIKCIVIQQTSSREKNRSVEKTKLISSQLGRSLFRTLRTFFPLSTTLPFSSPPPSLSLAAATCRCVCWYGGWLDSTIHACKHPQCVIFVCVVWNTSLLRHISLTLSVIFCVQVCIAVWCSQIVIKVLVVLQQISYLIFCLGFVTLVQKRLALLLSASSAVVFSTIFHSVFVSFSLCVCVCWCVCCHWLRMFLDQVLHTYKHISFACAVFWRTICTAVAMYTISCIVSFF